MQREGRFKSRAFPLAIGEKAFINCRATGDKTTGTLKQPAVGNANLVSIGDFAETVDNSAGAATVQVLVELDHEIFTRYYDSVTGAGAVTAANLFSDVYWFDNNSVTTSSSGNSLAGRVWGVSTINGVEVEFYNL
jgi:hypothetical protein